MLWRWGTLVQNVVVQGAEAAIGVKESVAEVVVGVGVGGQGNRNESVPQMMSGSQITLRSAGALGFVLAVGMELYWELGRRARGMGSLRCGERCECGYDRDGELHIGGCRFCL